LLVVDAAGDFEVEGEELGEEVLLGREAVGGEDGGVADRDWPCGGSRMAVSWRGV
jgi:hypothetical protein